MRRGLGFLYVGGLALIVALVGGVIWFRAQSEDTGPTTTSDGPPPFTAPQGEATVVDADRITVVASSFLQPDGSITYDAGNMIDRDLLTAWNSDSREEDGRGETLTFRFSEPVDLKAVRFVNGYAKNDGVYSANHRIKELLVTTDGSSQIQPVTLLDTSDRQEITVDFGLTTRVMLEIVEIYPGEGFDDEALTADLALTEVAFIAVQP